ncbi:MAG TPA: hypothetical protein P5560_12060 [Thermotogota bacterium]|nr:hypothetical protein [Thermotogota bacterium]HRW93675.1 hypothetical protein [Thermotogota bacterium]
MDRIRAYQYTMQVISHCNLGKKQKRDLAKQVMDRLELQSSLTGMDDPVKLLGDPLSVAKEMCGSVKDEIPSGTQLVTESGGFPLVSRKEQGIAFGVIAIGPMAVGVVAVGGLAIGVFSLGGMSVGLFALGGVALAGLFGLGGVVLSAYVALGGMALSMVLSIGGLAISNTAAIGGFAQAPFAMGGEARGIVAVFQTRGVGSVLIPMYRTTWWEIQQAIRTSLPDLPDWIQSLARQALDLLR